MADFVNLIVIIRDPAGIDAHDVDPKNTGGLSEVGITIPGLGFIYLSTAAASKLVGQISDLLDPGPTAADAPSESGITAEIDRRLERAVS